MLFFPPLIHFFHLVLLHLLMPLLKLIGLLPPPGVSHHLPCSIGWWLFCSLLQHLLLVWFLPLHGSPSGGFHASLSCPLPVLDSQLPPNPPCPALLGTTCSSWLPCPLLLRGYRLGGAGWSKRGSTFKPRVAPWAPVSSSYIVEDFLLLSKLQKLL